MHKKVIVFRPVDGIYFGDSLLNDDSWILSSFLTDDVGSRGLTFKNFIQDYNRKRTSSNFSRLIKEGDDILIGCQLDNPYENCIRMSQKEFISILDQWDNLIKQRPEEIIVYEEGDTYRLEGHGFPDTKR